MKNKLVLVVLGMLFLSVASFGVLKYTKFLKKENKKCNTLQQNCYKEGEISPNNFDLDSLLRDGYELSSSFKEVEEFPFLIGEYKTIKPVSGVNRKINIEFIHEIKDVTDQSNNLRFRVYRVGREVKPPKYWGTIGRIFLQITDLKTEGYPSNVYDTQLDQIDPLGEVKVQGEKLVIKCFDGPEPRFSPCEYEIIFSKESKNIEIVRKR